MLFESMNLKTNTQPLINLKKISSILFFFFKVIFDINFLWNLLGIPEYESLLKLFLIFI